MKKEDSVHENDPFVCPHKGKILVKDCLVFYMDANAMEVKESKCWRCPAGTDLRRRYRLW